MNVSEKSNDIIIKQFVYGSIAFWLGKKADETVSHKWCVYVRGVNNEDISYFVKEVVFTLHSSFTNHIRVVTKYPFELYEVGWGQFDIIITIHLIDENAKPIELVHPLKLYPSQPHAAMSTKKPVVSESYEEIVFVNPKHGFREILLNPSLLSNMQVENDKRFSEDSITSQEPNEASINRVNGRKLKTQPSFMSLASAQNKLEILNLNTQMDITPSQLGITPSFQQKLDNLNIDSQMDIIPSQVDITRSFQYNIIGYNQQPFQPKLEDHDHNQVNMNVDSHREINLNGDTVSVQSNYVFI